MTYKKTYIPAHENEEFKHKCPNLGGRPKKTLADLPKNWKKKLITLAKQGGCITEIKVYILNCISDDLFNRFEQEEPEFSRIISVAKRHSEAWWKKQGRENIKNTNFQTNLYTVNMINRFDDFKSIHTHSKSVIEQHTTHEIKTVIEIKEEDMKLIEEISDRTPKDKKPKD